MEINLNYYIYLLFIEDNLSINVIIFDIDLKMFENTNDYIRLNTLENFFKKSFVFVFV